MSLIALAGLAWRFRKLVGIVAVVAGLLGAGLYVRHRIVAWGNERYAAGEVAEAAKWQLELDRLKAEQEIVRQEQETQLRAIATKLADEEAARRDDQDGFDRDITKLESDDAKAGTPANLFDPRVLHIVR